MIPIHLRNIPPPLETFDHSSLLAFFAKWIKPALYVEYGVRSGTSLMQVAPYCEKVHGIDINPIEFTPPKNVTFYQMSTDDYTERILVAKPMIDMVFIDACHESNQVFKDFEGIYPHVIEDGFIFLHDTYPYDQYMTVPHLCNDCYKVPYMIKEKYNVELVTLPFNPGMTIIKKKTSTLPACFSK